MEGVSGITDPEDVLVAMLLLGMQVGQKGIYG
jgi:hypothetical protein